jgi:NADH-quinone oxidoreductase subunit J
MTLIFHIAAIVAIISTVLVITQTNAVHALLYLVVSLLSIAVIFFVLGAHFIAALEVIIYAGAIMVLFIFVLMMLNMNIKTAKEEEKLLKPAMWIGPGILSLILLAEFIYVLASGNNEIFRIQEITPKQIGLSLFDTYLLGVELAGMLLMAGIIGAYHIGKEKKKSLHRFLSEESYRKGVNE